MIGRILGAAAGLIIALAGYGLLKPALLAKALHLSHLDLGPFTEHHRLIGGLVILVGVAVALAGLQREIGRKSKRPVATLFAESESMGSAHEA
jgi:hypothetical protein